MSATDVGNGHQYSVVANITLAQIVRGYVHLRKQTKEETTSTLVTKMSFKIDAIWFYDSLSYLYIGSAITAQNLIENPSCRAL